MNRRVFFIFTVLLFTGIKLFSQPATKWRGPDGNGVYPESGVLKEWPSSGPEIIWHFDGLGQGHSSPAFAHNTIYLSGMEETTGYIYALSPFGGLKWKTPYGEEFHESYPGSRSTPVIAGDLLYIFSGRCVLVCLDAHSGQVKWRKDGIQQLGGSNITWGVTETVVVDGDLVYFTPGGPKNNLVALNRFTGDMIWSSPAKSELSAYCTPLLVELSTRKLLVTHTASHIVGLDAVDGKLLWSYPHPNQYQVHPNTPIYHEGSIFCFSGYGQGGVKLDLNVDGSSITKSWTSNKPDSRMGGFVLIDGYLYGSGDSNRQWRCLDWKTGEEKFASTTVGKGVVVAADGMLFCYSERGELALAKATPDGFNPTGQTKVVQGSGQHWAHPVIHDGRLYLRHGNSLIAYRIK